MLQVLAEEIFTPAHALDTIRACACPNTGRCGQNYLTLSGQAERFRYLPFQRMDAR